MKLRAIGFLLILIAFITLPPIANTLNGSVKNTSIYTLSEEEEHREECSKTVDVFASNLYEFNFFKPNTTIIAIATEFIKTHSNFGLEIPFPPPEQNLV